MIDTWDPAQYEKFQREREQPFFDLLGMVRPEPLMRVVDLGCGTGKQTRALHERLQARETMGLDQSPKMLESQATAALPAGLHFEVGTIEDFPGSYGTFDLVFSNAALHWVDDHDILLPRLASAVGPRGRWRFRFRRCMTSRATSWRRDLPRPNRFIRRCVAGSSSMPCRRRGVMLKFFTASVSTHWMCA
jgi:trans-aconitate methyltransferase